MLYNSITTKISLSKLSYEIRRVLPRGPHKIGGLGTCILLMNYLTQTNFDDDNIKVIRYYDHDDTTF